jgi:ribosomal protein L11 methyltransferase
LRALSDVDLHGTRVLDLGTGSGVLALAASLRGAAHVLALDVDDDAIESARESHRLNPAASGIEWLVADFRHAGHAQIDRVWDVVVANLTGGMLRSSAERLRELVRPGGVLIVSGFDEQERADVQAALRMDECAALSEDAWVGLVLRQPASEPR